MTTIKREPLNPWVVGGPEYHPMILSLYRKEGFRKIFAALSYQELWEKAQSTHTEGIKALELWFTNQSQSNPGEHLASGRIAAALALLAADALGDLLNAPHNRTDLFSLYQEINAFALARSEALIHMLSPGPLSTAKPSVDAQDV